jgi:hypothetical protein
MDSFLSRICGFSLTVLCLCASVVKASPDIQLSLPAYTYERDHLNTCSSTTQSSSACISGRFAMDLLHEVFNQYDMYSATEFANPFDEKAGFRVTGYLQTFVDSEFTLGQMHLGLVYFPSRDRGRLDSVSYELAQQRMALMVEEAYLDFKPIEDLPFYVRAGKSLSPFGATAITYPRGGDDHPVYATNTFLLTQTRANVLAFVYDDYESTGVTSTAYLQSHHNTVDQKTGHMEAWGLQLAYQTPFDRVEHQFAWGANVAMVSNPEAAIYLSELNIADTHPAYSSLMFFTLKRLTVELAGTLLHLGSDVTARAVDYAINYRLAYLPNIGTSNMFFGWGKSHDAVSIELPETSWWIGVNQSVDHAIDLALLMTHSRSYTDSVAGGRADRKFVFRLSYAF